MTQATFTAVRQALAATLAKIPGLNTYGEYAEQITVPAAIILPVQGTFLSYVTQDGALNVSLRAALCVARADGTGGQALMDPFLATTGTQSVFAALAADPRLGGTVDFAALIEATGYGPISVGAIDYLGCHLIISIGI
jgi:hypothetical protein